MQIPSDIDWFLNINQYSVGEGCVGHTHIAAQLHIVTHIHRIEVLLNEYRGTKGIYICLQ